MGTYEEVRLRVSDEAYRSREPRASTWTDPTRGPTVLSHAGDVGGGMGHLCNALVAAGPGVRTRTHNEPLLRPADHAHRLRTPA